MIVTFGATFSGVIASFLLWYFGQWLLTNQTNKKKRDHQQKYSLIIHHGNLLSAYFYQYIRKLYFRRQKRIVNDLL